MDDGLILETCEVGEGVFDLKDLMSVELHADPKRCNIYQPEDFIIRWETCLTGMKRDPDEDTKLTLFKKQIEFIELLDYDMQAYKRLRDPSQKTYAYLKSACQSLIDMRRLEENQRKVHRSTRKSASPAKAAPAQPSRGRPPTRNPSRKRNGSANSKSKSRSASPRSRRRVPSRSPLNRSGKGKALCFDCQKGKCTRGAGCCYAHSVASPGRFSPGNKSNSPSGRRTSSKSSSPASKKKLP